MKALLAAAPDKTISLRKEGYDVKNVKIPARANPHLLRLGGYRTKLFHSKLARQQ